MANAASEQAVAEPVYQGHGSQTAQTATEGEGQHHSIKVYLQVWALLFVVSVLSYLCDFLEDGFVKWFLICAFMLLKAGLIVAVFMHMMWERLAIKAAVLVPTGVLLVLMLLMALEANYTLLSRLQYFLT